MIFHYKAMEQSGKVVNDLTAATNQHEVADSLKAKGLVVLEIVSEEEWRKGQKKFSFSEISFGGRVSLIEKISFAQHLATMIKAGLPLAESLEILEQDTRSGKLKKILEEAKYGLESGKPLSIRLAEYPDVFDKGFINMLKAGELSGNLVNVLEQIAKKLQQDYDLISKVKGAMMYPAVIFCALIMVGLLMLIVVVPKIADVFIRLNVDIPLPTQVMMFLSKIFIAKPLVSFPILVVAIVLIVLFFRSNNGKKFLAWLVHSLPFVKNVAKQVDLTRFNHSLSLLLKSGVPITSALETAADTVSEEKVKNAIVGFKDRIVGGQPLAKAFRESERHFPLLMIRMISVGEKTGKLDQILEELADFYRKETEQALQTVANLVEPILMFVIGIVIGAMVLAIIGPMYSIVQQISK